MPFPEPGVRLIKQANADEFAATMDDEPKSAAGCLGSLDNPQGYPEISMALIGATFAFPTVEPPDDLVALPAGLRA